MNSLHAWQATLGQLETEMSRAAFETWVRSAELVSCADDTFTIGVQNAYARDYLESRLSSSVERLLSGFMNSPQQVRFVVWHKDSESVESAPQSEVDDSVDEEPRNAPALNERYTFDNFVVGPSNRLAYAACMAVAESPAKAYNPLFLYGGVGLGKTHLLYAIGNAVAKRGLRVLYVSSEEFTNDHINSIRTHTTVAFRERYRQMDVLLVDDIQFIAGKESTQEEFFHTFNTLHGLNKQIVVSSDRSPKALLPLEERLRSRFEWGLTADIQLPDLETRIAVLRSKAERSGRKVPDEILEAIARQFQSNIRELEGALTRVLAFADLTNQLLTMQLVNVALTDLLPLRRDVQPSQVVDAVADVFGIPTERLLGRDRSHEVALPRQVAMYLLREEINVSLPQIGAAMGGRDHTTVMYACEKVADMIESDDRLRRQVVQIKDQLYGRRVAV
ncbi:MAG: chromosomal replication initiator protein DnaA [Anaerolineaceae bacterium]|jgi:chromosomal replication initiator protein